MMIDFHFVMCRSTNIEHRDPQICLKHESIFVFDIVLVFAHDIEIDVFYDVYRVEVFLAGSNKLLCIFSVNFCLETNEISIY